MTVAVTSGRWTWRVGSGSRSPAPQVSGSSLRSGHPMTSTSRTPHRPAGVAAVADRSPSDEPSPTASAPTRPSQSWTQCMGCRTGRLTGSRCFWMNADHRAAAAAVRPSWSNPPPQARPSDRGFRLSPDGRFAAFVSQETGRDEVYVRSTSGGRRVLVSSSGGDLPRWRQDSRELYYRGADNALFVVAVDPQRESFGSAQHLFRVRMIPTRAFELRHAGWIEVPGHDQGWGRILHDMGPQRDRRREPRRAVVALARCR